jgi:hypothetical protein
MKCQGILRPRKRWLLMGAVLGSAIAAQPVMAQQAGDWTAANGSPPEASPAAPQAAAPNPFDAQQASGLPSVGQKVLGALAAAAVLAYVLGADHSEQQEADDEGGTTPLPRGGYGPSTDNSPPPDYSDRGCSWGWGTMGTCH